MGIAPLHRWSIAFIISSTFTSRGLTINTNLLDQELLLINVLITKIQILLIHKSTPIYNM